MKKGISLLLNKRFLATVLAAAAIATTVANAAYIPTNRDTRLPPDPVTYDIVETDEFTFLSKVGSLEYYFREDRDVFLIVDTRNGYSWKTGLDVAFNTDIDAAVAAAETPEEKVAAAIPKEDRLNATYTGFANSFLSVEIYDDSFNTSIISSAAQNGAQSSLGTIAENHYRLDVDFTNIDLQISAHIHLTENGIVTRVYDDEISGEGANIMASVILMPFLGASGGVQIFYDEELRTYSERIAKPMIPGYVFVPDGSGALIRFREFNVTLRRYEGNVYGVNLAESTYYYNDNANTVSKKDPLMPVFGIAHGDNQAAFVAWADDGAEHMQIIFSPHENMTYYNFAYPRFIYNRQIHQVYNRRGDGYFRLFPERHDFNIEMTYFFLAGDEENERYSADYVGMALAYRDFLIDKGELTENYESGDIPLRLDFVMSDIKKGIVGTSNVVTTTTEQVEDILNDVQDMGITNINSGLLGFQNGGITAGRPWTLNFSGSIGSRSNFGELFENMNMKGIDLSISQDYAKINSLQMRLPSNQAYHINNWGIRDFISHEVFVPVTEISYARPTKSAEWLERQSSDIKKLGAESMTVTGITGLLLSHYGPNATTVEETVELYRNTFENMDMKVNAETPNQYLWKYVDRFLQAPILTTQYILQTDTVPFLQIVLNGTMEVYSPYANFSLYTQNNILRMIDYNVYPSFVLTHEPAYNLSSTNSLMYYSTEYSLYRDIIEGVYSQINETLSHVRGMKWIARTVLENGVIRNDYDGGASVIINYTDDAVSVDGEIIPPQTAKVIR